MLGASAFVLLLINPFLIKEVGFQLSYLAVTGIVYLYPKIFPLLATGNWLWDKVWALVVVSFSAQLATFPLSIYYFNQFPNYFLITNILVIPLATIILYLGILTLLSAWIPLLGSALAFLLRIATEALNEVILVSSGLPFAVSKGLYFSSVATVLVYVLIVFSIRTYYDPRHGNLKILMASLTVLVLMYSFSLARRTNTSSITSFHVNGHTAIAATNGRFVHVWSDLYPDQLDKLKFAMEGYLNEIRPVQITYSSTMETYASNGIESKDHMISCGPLTVLLINDVFPKGADLDQEIDGVFISGKIDPETYPSCFLDHKPTVVIDGSVPYYQWQRLTEEAISASDLWFTNEKGAFQISSVNGF
jgi:competence protein ComEC